MKIANKLNSIINIQLFVFLFLSVNLSFANNKIEPTSNTKHSATDVNDFNEKTKQEKREDSNKKSSGTNYHDIMSTTCLLYTSPSPRDRTRSRMPSSA